MARAIWSGTIAFGLVSIPVRMESAVEEHTLHFNYVHEPDGGRIGYQKVCKAEDRPVPDDEVVKAFEIRKGKWVYLSDEDFESAQLEQRGRTIDIQAFVARDEIDPIFFERTYYLTPQEGGEKLYALLARAMEESELVAVATFVMREREHLACLRVRERVITLERMHFADEVRPAKDLAPKGVRVARTSSSWPRGSSISTRASSARRPSRTRIATLSGRSFAPRSEASPSRWPSPRSRRLRST